MTLGPEKDKKFFAGHIIAKKVCALKKLYTLKGTIARKQKNGQIQSCLKRHKNFKKARHPRCSVFGRLLEGRLLGGVLLRFLPHLRQKAGRLANTSRIMTSKGIRTQQQYPYRSYF